MKDEKVSSKNIEKLRNWFLSQKRDLPWRNQPSPYEVWVSEVMLQQTQVSVVIPYYERWMKAFPSIETLAAASIEQVIKHWEGLGYYSRARYLHQGAKMVVDLYGGNLPSDAVALKQIKGLGPYTIGAIQSFAFQQKAAAVDGNVLRVISRVFGIQAEINQPSTVKKIQTIVLNSLPEHEPWVINEALIELGAIVCKRVPDCLSCPLKEDCYAFLEHQTAALPVKKKAVATTYLHRLVPILCYDNDKRFLVQKGLPGKIMQDLHEFPYLDINFNDDQMLKVTQFIEEHFQLEIQDLLPLPSVTHSFTRYQATLYPFFCQLKAFREFNHYQWYSKEELTALAFSSGHRRIYDYLRKALL